MSGRSRRFYRVVKRLLDFIAGVTLLAMLFPLLVLIAVAVKIDSPGPVLFRQRRVGRYGRPFTMAKFRTMEHGADESFLTEHLRHLAALGEKAGGESAHLRLDEDPRVTRVGARLRRWSFDELPNLVNVVLGPISLVGPRPLVPEEMEIMGPAAAGRLAVKPGITGLAQVHGRDLITIDERTRLDLEYVERCSLRLDLEILLDTARAVLRQPGA
jgi:lipopolysaccharide/colanic/teichoic acid biosynthesis glycosyltransferase